VASELAATTVAVPPKNDKLNQWLVYVSVFAQMFCHQKSASTVRDVQVDAVCMAAMAAHRMLWTVCENSPQRPYRNPFDLDIEVVASIPVQCNAFVYFALSHVACGTKKADTCEAGAI
jgi:hypothetical protein